MKSGPSSKDSVGMNRQTKSDRMELQIMETHGHGDLICDVNDHTIQYGRSLQSIKV